MQRTGRNILISVMFLCFRHAEPDALCFRVVGPFVRLFVIMTVTGETKHCVTLQ